MLCDDVIVFWLPTLCKWLHPFYTTLPSEFTEIGNLLRLLVQLLCLLSGLMHLGHWAPIDDCDLRKSPSAIIFGDFDCATCCRYGVALRYVNRLRSNSLWQSVLKYRFICGKTNWKVRWNRAILVAKLNNTPRKNWKPLIKVIFS